MPRRVQPDWLGHRASIPPEQGHCRKPAVGQRAYCRTFRRIAASLRKVFHPAEAAAAVSPVTLVASDSMAVVDPADEADKEVAVDLAGSGLVPRSIG